MTQFEDYDTYTLSGFDRTANSSKYPPGAGESIVPFILPQRPEYDERTAGRLYSLADVKFFINVHNNLRYLTLEYEYDFSDCEGPQQLMVYAFYVETINNGRAYRLYLETPGDEYHPLHILELTYLPLVYTMDTRSREYLLKFVEHNNSHDTGLSN